MARRRLRSSVTHRTVRANQIDIHLTEAGHGPPVVLLHGFPELSYSWRHQLPVLAEAGYHAIAPDLRGYGRTSVPAAVEDYAMVHMVADVTGVLDVLGAHRAVIAGHDWGANIAWACAQLHPDRVAAVVALSVPFQPRTQEPPLQLVRQTAAARFNWVLYFQERAAEAELEQNAARSPAPDVLPFQSPPGLPPGCPPTTSATTRRSSSGPDSPAR